MYGCIFVAYWQSYCLHVALWNDKNVILVVNTLNTKLCNEHCMKKVKRYYTRWGMHEHYEIKLIVSLNLCT